MEKAEQKQKIREFLPYGTRELVIDLTYRLTEKARKEGKDEGTREALKVVTHMPHKKCCCASTTDLELANNECENCGNEIN